MQYFCTTLWFLCFPLTFKGRGGAAIFIAPVSSSLLTKVSGKKCWEKKDHQEARKINEGGSSSPQDVGERNMAQPPGKGEIPARDAMHANAWMLRSRCLENSRTGIPFGWRTVKSLEFLKERRMEEGYSYIRSRPPLFVIFCERSKKRISPVLRNRKHILKGKI